MPWHRLTRRAAAAIRLAVPFVSTRAQTAFRFELELALLVWARVMGYRTGVFGGTIRSGRESVTNAVRRRAPGLLCRRPCPRA